MSAGAGERFRKRLAVRYALVFALLGATAAVEVVLVENLWLKALFVWCAVAFVGVGAAYAGLGPRALFKGRSGQIRLPGLLLFGPYHALNALLRALLHSRRYRSFDQIGDNLYLGPLPTWRERAALEAAGICSVLDVTGEFTAPGFVRRGANYRCIPLLDMTAPTIDVLEDGADWILARRQDGPVYVHCALGRGRSALFVAASLLRSGLASTPDDAIAQVREKRPSVKLNALQRAILEQVRPASAEKH